MKNKLIEDLQRISTNADGNYPVHFLLTDAKVAKKSKSYIEEYNMAYNGMMLFSKSFKPLSKYYDSPIDFE